MIWRIPAKTFLLGEYAALAQGSAMLLTTNPCFEFGLCDQNKGFIHPDSPAGQWLKLQALGDSPTHWFDPYEARGGLGGSSAEFIGAYLATCLKQPGSPSLSELLQAYYRCAWSGQGLKPSGYDLIAQTQHRCVFINSAEKRIESLDWPFKDLSFLLVHTGVKLATHNHLLSSSFPPDTSYLSKIADQARTAFTTVDSQALVHCVNTYHQALQAQNLVAEHSLQLISTLSILPEVLAIKGCGAMGSDILLLLCPSDKKNQLIEQIKKHPCSLLASETNLHTELPLIQV